MAKKVIHARVQQRHDTRAAWESSNPVLLAGELGFVTDDHSLYKLGDGITPWNSLPYRGATGGSTDPELLETYMPMSRDFSDDFNNDFAR